MRQFTSALELREAIRTLEEKQQNEWKLFQEKLLQTYENFKISNLIKNTILNLIESPGIFEKIIFAYISYLSRKYVTGKSGSLLKKISAGMINSGLKEIIDKYSDTVKNVLIEVLKFVFGRKKRKPENVHEQHNS